VATAGLAARLMSEGHVALDDLAFETGAAALAAGDPASLADLAAFLAANPGARVTLVGHTDAEGSLEANIALSRRRAEAVAAVLVGQFGVARGQVAAAGAGWLAPRASNATPEGRARNRRVEAVLTAGP
jgi:OOP family OmpA-OmpF porin